MNAMLDTLVTGGTEFLLEALQRPRCREEGPGATILQPQEAPASGEVRLKGEARLGDAIEITRVSFDAKSARFRLGERC